MKKDLFFVFIPIVFSFLACQNRNDDSKVVVCVPVYGQSLALGEETQRITNLDSLNELYDYRIVGENLKNEFGYYDCSPVKRKIKRVLKLSKRDFEVSVYGMAEALVNELGKDTMVCVFAGGQGATPINGISKGTAPYVRFLNDIKNAKEKADEKGMKFYVPAICWMQGESDMYDYTNVDYKQKLNQFCIDINKDIKAITHQKQDIKIVSYQTNMLALCNEFCQNEYSLYETSIPQAQMELVRDNSFFVAGTPTYFLSFARERMHINAISQKRVGYYNAESVISIIRNQKHRGLYPKKIISEGTEVKVVLDVPCPPLVIDTIEVSKVDYYGFNVVTASNESIIKDVVVHGDTVLLKCSQLVKGAKVRYAVNGQKGKSGYLRGARGNLRDSQCLVNAAIVPKKIYPMHNWCYQFDILVE